VVISEAFASVLSADRSTFNARFIEAQRRFPGLSGKEFGAFLRTRVNDVVAAVGAMASEKVAETASVAYDVALELVGQGLVGSGARHGCIEEGWRRLLPAASRHVAESPARVLPAVCNALHHLATTPGARPSQWLDDLERLAEMCSHVDEFLICGQIAAWLAGMAHFRASALEAADTLPESLAKAVLGIPAAVAWATVREQMECDPWFDPENAIALQQDTAVRLRVGQRAGAFKGFGGLFLEPPKVTGFGAHFLVSSGGEHWLLVADLFGATFHRADPAVNDAPKRQSARRSGVSISGTTIHCSGVSLDLPELGSFTSVAANRHTLALTSPLTHAVVLVVLGIAQK
jgi:hypothetical protein